MLDIKVTKKTTLQNVSDNEIDYKIEICIKQSYEMILTRVNNDVQVKIPSFSRPVFKFNINLNSNLVYKEHWNVLKRSILNNTSFSVIFNYYDGEHSIKFKDKSLIFTIYTDEHGDFTYWIPIEDNQKEILQMIDEIRNFYPDKEPPISFNYSEEEFPIYIAYSSSEDIKIQHFTKKYSNANVIRLTRDRALEIFGWLNSYNNDRTSILPAKCSLTDNTLHIEYTVFGWCSSLSIPENRFEMFKNELSNALK